MDVLYSDNEPKVFVAESGQPDSDNEEFNTFQRKQIWDTVRKEYSKYCIKESLDESTQLYRKFIVKLSVDTICKLMLDRDLLSLQDLIDVPSQTMNR
jgi:hypothetical protein